MTTQTRTRRSASRGPPRSSTVTSAVRGRVIVHAAGRRGGASAPGSPSGPRVRFSRHVFSQTPSTEVSVPVRASMLCSPSTADGTCRGPPRCRAGSPRLVERDPLGLEVQALALLRTAVARAASIRSVARGVVPLRLVRPARLDVAAAQVVHHVCRIDLPGQEDCSRCSRRCPDPGGFARCTWPTCSS